ncbi:MAG: hypothetical protein Kow0062_00680 [Acidobacteriota bacterium]
MGSREASDPPTGTVVEQFAERLAQADGDPAPPAATDRYVAPDEHGAGSLPRRVLVALGSSRRNARLEHALREADWEPLVATPDRALALAIEARPAVAVVPWHLRDATGRRVAETIRRFADAHASPLLLVPCRSGRMARAALDAAADDVVLRPWHPRLLLDRIEKIVAHADRARELEQLRRTAGRGPHVPPRDHFPDRKPDGIDRLTGLPDGDALVRALLGALASGVGPQRRAAVVLLDIDRFRNVNRSFGRARSNVVLQVFARRLAHAAAQSRGAVSTGAGTSTAMAARLGGDRFALLLTGLDDSVDLPPLVEQVRRKLAEDYILGDGSRVHLTASIGVALAPDDAKDAVGLLDCAELAMEEAAEVGDGIVRFHGDACGTWTDRHVRLAGCLAGAVERGELSVHYQPIVEASGGRIVAAEALLRWTSPELGAVSPAEFVPIAEERGLMERIGSWVLDETCRLMSSWRADGMPPLRMSVNVSIGQLIRSDFADTVRAIVERHGVPPPALELEISERGVLRDDPLVRQQLAAVRALGCRLAIDDFGTGNSGVAYLKRFPLTTLKIDRSIVSGVLRSEEDAAITTAITAMARQLQLTVVAEGVETEGQRRFLALCGCDELQGFLFSRPVDASALRELVLARAAHEPVPR